MRKLVKVWRQGDSLVVSIPSKIAKKLGIQRGDYLLPKLEGDKITYRKVKLP